MLHFNANAKLKLEEIVELGQKVGIEMGVGSLSFLYSNAEGKKEIIKPANIAVSFKDDNNKKSKETLISLQLDPLLVSMDFELLKFFSAFSSRMLPQLELLNQLCNHFHKSLYSY